MERSYLKTEPLEKKNKTKQKKTINYRVRQNKARNFIQIWQIVGIKTALKIGDKTNQDEIEQS